MSEFVSTMKKARAKLGLPQIRLGRKTGIPQALLSQYENETKSISPKMANTIAAALVEQAVKQRRFDLQVEGMATIGPDADGRLLYELTLKRGKTIFEPLRFKGRATLHSPKSLYKPKAHQLSVIADFLEAALPSVLEGRLGEEIEALPKTVAGQIAQRILEG